MISTQLKESVSTSSLNTFQWTVYARFSNTLIISTARDLKRLVFSLLRKIIRRSLPQPGSRTLTKKKCCKSSESIGNRGDKVEAIELTSNKMASMCKAGEDDLL